jgi:hypothetical protein
LGHDRERPSLGILEECHPLLGAVGVAMDHVRLADELDAASFHPLARLRDVRHPEIEYGLRGRRLLLLIQHQARAAAVEERHRSERVQVPQPERLAVPVLGPFDIGNGPGYLPDPVD